VTVDIRYPNLHDACREFLSDALHLLRQHPPGVGTSPGETGTAEQLYRWLGEHRQELIALPSAARASAAVAQAGLNIGRVSDSEGKDLAAKTYAPWHVFEIVLAPLVAEYVGAKGGRSSYSARLYSTIYARLEERYSIGPLCRFVAPLENFDSERPRIRLESDLWIERLTNADSERLASFFHDFGPRSLAFLSGLRRPQWGIAMVAHDHPFAPFSGHEGKFNAVTLALRLAAPEPVGHRFVVHYPARRTSQYGMTAGASWSMRPDLRYGPRYVLRRADQGRFRSTFRALSSGLALTAYPLAFSRFDDAYWRQSAADALVDIWIALESLFMPDGDPREATYRLALRIAYFLGRTSDDRVAIDRNIRDSYRLRSDVVHGRSYSSSVLDAFTEKTANYLRRALRSVAQKGAQLDVDSIDRCVRAGKKPSDAE